MFRILVASLLGGTLMFVGGAFSHMALELESRAMVNLPDETTMKSEVTQQRLAPGMYSFPGMRTDLSSLSVEEQTTEMEKTNKLYKEGPAGILIVAPTGEDMMSSKQLGGEFVADVGAAFIASLLMYFIRPDVGLVVRWLLLVLFAPVSWLNLSLSHWLWYRFPMPFVLDGFYCALIEWSLAGLVIAAIAGPSNRPDKQAAA